MGLDAARGLLACPVCAEGLDLGPAAATCRQGHSFDVARQGHLNLLGAAQPANADTAAMVEARSRVLDSGAFDAVDAALARGCDTVLVDTAGRMHTREPLMRELQKVREAIHKRLPGAPHHTWLVLDAMLGQNAVVQARQFHDITPLTGIVATKLDGSSKGGFLFAIRQELDLPIRFVGLGESPDDLAPFEPKAFVSALMNSISAP